MLHLASIAKGQSFMGTTRVVLDQVNLVVSDMQRSSDFYRRLGVAFEAGDSGWGLHHRSGSGSGESGGASLDLDSLSFAAQWGRIERTGPVIGFRVEAREDVDRIYAELTAAGHAGQQPPYDAFWGSRFAVVQDPDGNSVALMSPSEAAYRTRPPAPPR
jgi:catechol 2,3-dioxygenase-like lactoylglutathione lyase family enzyme